ncbi:biotin holocarboxylase synthetase, partial [Spiromyces aspiralis]
VGVHRRAFIRQDPLVSGIVPDSAYLYFNGGGLFVGAHELDYRDGNRCGTDRDLLLPKQQQQQQQHEGTIVDVLADFPPDVPNPWNRSEILANATAIVGCRLGRGRAVLTGVHPEYNTLDLDPADYTTPYNRNLVEVLLAGDSDRKRLLYAMFRYLGFEPRRPEDTLASWYDLNGVPLQTPTFLTPIIVGGSDGGSADFGTKLKRLVDPNTGTFKDTGGDVAVVDPQDCGQYLDAAPIDITSSTPTVITCPPGVYPCNKATPHFNMADFAHQVQSKGLIAMGSWAMYTEVVTSTQTFLEK